MRNSYVHGDKQVSYNNFDAIKISIASPEEIRSWSYGEVKKTETINYRTFQPEKDGLFCARIFGPMKDYECLCGRYKRSKYKGIICEKCGVEVTVSRVRRERMGHIELAAPVVHAWFMKSIPSRISIILDMNLKDLERILYFEKYVVLDPGFSHFSYGELISEAEYYDAINQYGNTAFVANIGAEAIKKMLQNIDLEKEVDKLKTELKDDIVYFKKKKIVNRLKILNAFLKNGTKPEHLVLTVLPVMSPELRPLVHLDGGRFAASDLNDLYRRVINRNNRLKRLVELRAPDIIIRNEKRMLQESVDSLFDNKRRGSKNIIGSNNRPLKSLSDVLKGKYGRFRQNLLGKRVDYSGRSVITVGPELKLHQCGLPKKMAIELFRPFVYAKLEKYGHSGNIKIAKRMVENGDPIVMDILEEVVSEHPVLLNRAPSLHRLSIQAFEPVLVEGKSIRLHPLSCTAFNADFDGDQMAVHVPLSVEAQLEARILMLASNNLLNPSSGKPIAVPTKDMVIGLYYLTTMIEGMRGEGKLVSSLNEVMYMLQNKIVTYHSKIRARIYTYGDDGKPVSSSIVETTPGRVMLWDKMPKNSKVYFDLINKELTATDMTVLVDFVYFNCGQKAAALFIDDLMTIGFKYATVSGISYGKDDLIIPEEKKKIISETEKMVTDFEMQYLDGFITDGEKYNKVIDAWDKCSEKIGGILETNVNHIEKGKQPNSIYMIVRSKARGSIAQLKQTVGMRGLMAKASGEIIETPIVSNFKEGLNVLEYFLSSHGSRKGLIDTALKTATSGYLTRRLVDVANDCVVTEEDCGTTDGMNTKAIIEGTNIVISLKDRIVGRYAAEDIMNPMTDELLFERNTYINEEVADAIVNAGIDEVKIRSAITCQSTRGVCTKCYGRDLATGNVVSIGEAVGIIAAQSIGEPGTQLTLRTFHIGGVAQKASEVSNITSNIDAKVSFKNVNSAINSVGDHIVCSKKSEIELINVLNNKKVLHKIPYGAKLKVSDGELIKIGQVIAEWDPYTTPVVCEKDGFIKYIDLIPGRTLQEAVDEITGALSNVVTDWKQLSSGNEYAPAIDIVDDKGDSVTTSSGTAIKYFMSIDAIINVPNGAWVKKGDIIAKLPKEISKTKDITGGLPRVSELFEVRYPKDPAVIAEIDGTISFGKDNKLKRRIILSHEDEQGNITKKEYFVPKGRSVLVYDGDQVKKGDMLVDGNIVLSDIFRILGQYSAATYLIEEIQRVYRLQGVAINDKHIEIIARKMLQNCVVTDVGDSTLLKGDEISREEYTEINQELLSAGKKPISVEPVLQGITSASLHTRSFISAASFQETTRILIDAAIHNKIDNLLGLKENVIVGRLIPAGTGSIVQKMKEDFNSSCKDGCGHDHNHEHEDNCDSDVNIQ